MRKKQPAPDNTTIAKDAHGDYLICINCGQMHRFQLPLPIDQITKVMKAFVALHAFCPPAAPPLGWRRFDGKNHTCAFCGQRILFLPSGELCDHKSDCPQNIANNPSPQPALTPGDNT